MILKPVLRYSPELLNQTVGAPPWVLVGEDDADLLQVLTDYLEIEGYRMTDVPNGAEVVRTLQESAGKSSPRIPDILLTDFGSPTRHVLRGASVANL